MIISKKTYIDNGLAISKRVDNSFMQVEKIVREHV